MTFAFHGEPTVPDFTAPTLARRYVAAADSLAAAMQLAMVALTNNRCTEFEQHVASQGDLVSELSYVVPQLAAEIASNPAALEQLGASQRAQVQAAQRKLSDLNVCYRSFLARSRTSADLLAGLCRNFVNPTGGDLSTVTTWSCEG